MHISVPLCASGRHLSVTGLLEQWATKIWPETPRVREDGDSVDRGRRSRLRGDDPNPNQRGRETRGTIPLGLRARYPLNQPTREERKRRKEEEETPQSIPTNQPREMQVENEGCPRKPRFPNAQPP